MRVSNQTIHTLLKLVLCVPEPCLIAREVTLRFGDPCLFVGPAHNIIALTADDHAGILLDEVRRQTEVTKDASRRLMRLHAADGGRANVE